MYILGLRLINFIELRSNEAMAKPVNSQVSGKRPSRPPKRQGSFKKAHEGKRARPRKKPSGTSRGGLVGTCVFILGLIAVLGAGYVLYQQGPVRFLGTTIDLRALSDKLLVTQSQDTEDEENRDAGQNDQKIVKKPAPPAWYQTDLDPDSLPESYEGRYLSHFGSRQFELYLKDGIYQIVYSRAGETDRIFSRGQYGYRQGTLALKPDPEAPPPQDSGQNGISYQVMTSRIYTVELDQNNAYVFWDPGRLQEGETSRVVKHPVFKMVDANRLVWIPISEK